LVYQDADGGRRRVVNGHRQDVGQAFHFRILSASGDIALDVTNLASFRHCVRRSRAKNLPAEALSAHGREATVAGQRKNRVRVTVFLLGREIEVAMRSDALAA
jgi:hypothetical protein